MRFRCFMQKAVGAHPLLYASDLVGDTWVEVFPPQEQELGFQVPKNAEILPNYLISQPAVC